MASHNNSNTEKHEQLMYFIKIIEANFYSTEIVMETSLAPHFQSGRIFYAGLWIRSYTLDGRTNDLFSRLRGTAVNSTIHKNDV